MAPTEVSEPDSLEVSDVADRRSDETAAAKRWFIYVLLAIVTLVSVWALIKGGDRDFRFTSSLVNLVDGGASLW